MVGLYTQKTSKQSEQLSSPEDGGGQRGDELSTVILKGHLVIGRHFVQV